MYVCVCVCVCEYTYIFRSACIPAHWLVGRVFVTGPGDLRSIPSHGIPKTLKMVLDASLLSTQQSKARIKGKVEQSREKSSALLNTSVL